MPVHIDEMTTEVDAVHPPQQGGASSAPDGAAIAREVRAEIARLAELARRTQAESYDD